MIVMGREKILAPEILFRVKQRRLLIVVLIGDLACACLLLLCHEQKNQRTTVSA